jgi:NAD(P) transhydrogenase
MMAEAGADLFNRTCFNYLTLGDLYKYATYEAILKRDGLLAEPEPPGKQRCSPI